METNAKQRKWRKRKIAALAVALGTVGLWAFVKLNPMIFNESFAEHAHCIVGVDTALRMFANENQGRFPTHTNGFGDAVLALVESAGSQSLTGPMFDTSELIAAQRDGRDVDENKLGRIYVQGLSETSNPKIAVLFDQIATPGGDHAHFHHRLLAPYGREVLEIGNGKSFIRDVNWHAYATNQIELLVAEGIDRKTAQHYYEMTGLKFEE